MNMKGQHLKFQKHKELMHPNVKLPEFKSITKDYNDDIKAYEDDIKKLEKES